MYSSLSSQPLEQMLLLCIGVVDLGLFTSGQLHVYLYRATNQG